MANGTGFVWHELYMWHDTGTYAGVLPSGHGILEPEENTENAATKRRIKNLFDVSGLTEELVPIKPRPATEAELTAVHAPRYIEALKTMSAGLGGDARMDCPYGHTPFGPGGYDIAALAAGGVIEAAAAVMDGRVRNAYALVRPVGHHAVRDHGLGFCIFNNGAVAARWLMSERGVKRIAIVDWDVHHGNGAQEIFWEDGNVLTISIHQDRVFPPASGMLEDIGEGAGRGANLNIPLPPGCGTGAYLAVFERVVVPALRRFRPDVIIVPCGYDAGAFDPLARMMLHSECFRAMTRMIMDAADELCGGRLVLCHEGGYHKASVPFLALAVVETLSGVSTGLEDPWMMVFGGLGQQELQPHQEEAIRRAEALLPMIGTGS